MRSFFSGARRNGVFSSVQVEISKEIDGVAGCFYLGACTQGKGGRHSIRDGVST